MGDAYEDEPLLGVEVFASREDANAAGAELVGNGIGAAVEPVPDDEVAAGDAEAGYRVLVLEHELHRAQVVLGLAEPEDRPPANPEEPIKPLPRKTNWKIVAAIWLVALVVIPAAGFWLAYTMTAR